MPTWGEIQEYARSKYVLDNEENWFGLIWEYQSGRRQKIIVSRFNAFDRDWVQFRSAACLEHEMPPKVALRKNYDYAIGSLAIDPEGRYVFLHSLQLDSLDIEEFELPLHVIARTADELESGYAEHGDKF
jgi:hypothetical protein